MSRRKRRASPQTLRAATRLARHAEWAKGFWLAYLFSIAPNQVHILQERLAAKLASIGREQRILRPETPQALEGILATILERPSVGCIWVEAIRDPEFEQGAWAKAWFNLILRTNERRELLREVLTGGLILVAHPGLKSAFRNAGPDLWSIRTMTFELPPGPASDADGQVAAHLAPRRPPKFVDVELLDKDMARWGEIAGEYSPEDQARMLMQLAARLRESGRHVEAAQASEAAVQRYRELATMRPLTFRAQLARALGDLGTDLAEYRGPGDRERADAAREASREAVEILRPLVGEHPEDDSLRLQLADALRELGDRLGTLGDTADALVALEEAVALYRESSGASPSGPSSLAQGLARLAGELLAQGQFHAALVLLEEAVDRLRTLGDVPLPLLAGHLINLGICLTEIGRREEGLKATEESVSIYRRLTEAHAREHAAHLARALHNLANQLHGLGRRYDAVATAEEAVAILHDSVAQSNALLPQLASELTVLGALLSDVGRHADALVVATEAVDSCRKLVRDHGEAYLPQLADALNNLALRIDDSGDRDKALRLLEESVGIYRHLAIRQPHFSRARLATALTNLGTQLGGRGKQDQALAAAREAVEILRDLSTTHPGRSPYELAASLTNLGALLAESNSSQEALAATMEAVELYRQKDGTGFDTLPYLASALSNLGSQLQTCGLHQEALVAAEEAVAIRRQLAAAQPSVFLPALAVEISNLGVQLNHLGRYDEALEKTQEAMNILRNQGGAHPGGLQDLGTVLHNLTRNLISLAKWRDALTAAEEAEHIRRKLSIRWPGKFGQAHAMSLALLGECRHAAEQPALAVEAFAEALRKLEPTPATLPLRNAIATALRESSREAGLELPEDLRERVAQLLE